MTEIIDTVEAASPDWLTEVLRGSGAITGARVSAATSELVGIGQLGLVARVALTYEGEKSPGAPRSVIVKLPATDAGSRATGVALGIYEAEVRFYREIASTVGVDVPHLHWGEVEPDSGRFTLVLEDLSARGTPGDMIAGGSADQAAAALASLVALQAPRWNDERLHDHGWLADPARSQILFAGVEPGLAAFCDRYADRLDPEDVALLERVAPKAVRWAERMLAGPTVVVHGDYRIDNLVFAADLSTPAAVFDWQTARLGPPLLDACVYLGGCLPLEQRRALERDLLREHHEQLLAAGVEGFSFDQLWDGYRWGVFWGLLLSVPMGVALERSERSDALFTGMVSAYGALARDHDCERLLSGL